MDKRVLVKKVAKETGFSVDDVGRMMNTMLSEMSLELCGRSGQVRLLGFGTFLTVERPEKAGRHPKTGEPMRIPPAMVVKFKAGSRLKRGLEEMTLKQMGAELGTRSVFLS